LRLGLVSGSPLRSVMGYLVESLEVGDVCAWPVTENASNKVAATATKSLWVDVLVNSIFPTISDQYLLLLTAFEALF
jgi:hypothetical protein